MLLDETGKRLGSVTEHGVKNLQERDGRVL
jgi:hypothetical protein